MAPQFTHSTSERRASATVFGSIGRGGLYVPQDFIKSNTDEILNSIENEVEQSIDDDISIGDESSSLLLHKSKSKSILIDEAKLLHANKVPIRKYSIVEQPIDNNNITYGSTNDGDDNGQVVDPEAILESWDEALKSGKITTTNSFELKSLTRSSIPLVITFLLQNSLGVCSVFAVGKISNEALAAITLGTMSANISAMSVIAGLASSLDTFLPQAYGANKFKIVGLIFQRCTALIFVIMFVICISWWIGSEWLLLKVLPDPISAKLASLYLKVLSFGIPGYILFETGKRFLQSQGIFDASTYILFICAPLNAIMNYLFVWTFGFGFIGAPIAVSLSYTFMAIGLYLYTIYTNHEINPMKCWDGLNLKKSFSNWNELIKLSIPNLIMIMSEFLSFEILTLLSSYLGTNALAAQSIITTMASLTYQIPYGVSIAASTRIANFLGAQLPKPAKIASKMTFLMTIFISIVNFSFLFICRYKIASWFSNDLKVIELVGDVMPLVAFIQFFDALNATSAGCLRGQGLQHIGGYINLFSYYVIGIPVGFILSFYLPLGHPLGLVGLWLGVGCALFIIGFVQCYYVLTANYDDLVNDALNRSNTE
ncbi:hypothetical protein CANARDRAFT_201266 [[Candida] arabinofermentans NRRL YB-2248]|uniref:Uncharacterized protein n=1 Tax=[Candida] arabinofermentans NRRL YB-2248 TaxID=983967 RepID=A0A1E4SXT5_9ASCO|nr:hypothetical protein CANARDRAFT_201266 [[Candida] arabinofermentans NRRL YB-2248]